MYDSKTALIEHEVSLYESDLLEVAERIAAVDKRRTAVESEKKASMARFNSEIQQCDAEMRDLLVQLRDKKATKTSECIPEFDYINNEVRYRLFTTGEIVKVRELTPEERQLKLFEDGPQKGEEDGEQ